MNDDTINHYIDVLAAAQIQADTSKKANYKTHAYQQASKSVGLFWVCQCIDQLLTCSAIKQVNLMFTLNDHDEWYKIETSVLYDGGQERFDDHPEFVYFLPVSDDDKRYAEQCCNELLKAIKNIPEETYGFFQYALDMKMFNKTDTAIGFLSQYMREEFAALENEIIAANVSSALSTPKKKI